MTFTFLIEQVSAIPTSGLYLLDGQLIDAEITNSCKCQVTRGCELRNSAHSQTQQPYDNPRHQGIDKAFCLKFAAAYELAQRPGNRLVTLILD